MKSKSNIFYLFISLLIIIICYFIYIQNKTLKSINEKIDVSHSNNSFGSFNNSFNNGDINDKVLNSEKEIENLKEDLESTKSDLDDTKSELEEVKNN